MRESLMIMSSLNFSCVLGTWLHAKDPTSPPAVELASASEGELVVIKDDYCEGCIWVRAVHKLAQT